MKTIIALSGKSNTGKTTALRTLFTQITGVTLEPGDISKEITYKGKTIFILSQGDPTTNVYKRLSDAILVSDIVICACRTKGDTVADVEKVTLEQKAELIRIGAFESITNPGRVNLLNEILASSILKIVDGVIGN